MSRSQRMIRDVLSTMAGSRSRTVLMVLALSVGAATLSTVVVLAQGTRERVLAAVAKHQLDMVMVRAGGEVQVFAPTADRGLDALREEDARAIEQVQGVTMVSSVQNQRGIDVVAGDRSVTTRAFGVEPLWMEIRRWAMEDGAFISDEDMAGMSRVAILGEQVANQLFPGGGAVGQTIRVQGDPFMVKGVFIHMGFDAAGVDNWDDRIVFPFTTSSRRLLGRPYLEQIVFRVSDVARVSEAAEQVRALLRVQHGVQPGSPDDFFVREPDQVQDAALESSNTMAMLLIGLSLVAMVAGGVVIANVMVLSVSARAHEIGVRRAVGASAADISRQFLLEAAMVALAAALVGGLGGVLLAKLLSVLGVATARVTALPFLATLVACGAVALVFGTQPARRAARIDPAATLRESRA